VDLHDLLEAVQNDRVAFVSTRPEGSPFAVLERQIIVTGPPELVELSRSGRVAALDHLAQLLRDSHRAWAAHVLLAAMTGVDEKEVDTFATMPDRWWTEMGGAVHDRWRSWLAEHKDKLRWNAEENVFVEVE
jgi:hypothetical protein